MAKSYKISNYAITDEQSQGRQSLEKFDRKDPRCSFQHDRDRIIHSRSFRRLEAKTQVVLIHENDHSRTRLTHSLEVSQMAETVAMSLGLNIYATQAIALGHDVGHTPFGHTGERALSDILEDYNLDIFKHNYQSLLVVNTLEKRYGCDNGLNLMYETRDGILKHSSLKRGKIDLKYYDLELNDEVDFPITMEGQIVSIVDEIAQRTHDTDDGLRTGRINIKDLLDQKIICDAIKVNKHKKIDLIKLYDENKKFSISTIIVSMVKYYILKIMENSKKNINIFNIKSYSDVLNSKNQLICFNNSLKAEDDKFRTEFLMPKFYEHHEIKRMDSRAEYFLKQIFKAFKNHPKQLPELTYKIFIEKVKMSLKKIIDEINDENIRNDIGNHLKILEDKFICGNGCGYIPKSKFPNKDQESKSFCPLFKNGMKACEGIRVIINHIAGMTDRYAHLEYSRLYYPPEISRL
jgi:dGTPase